MHVVHQYSLRLGPDPTSRTGAECPLPQLSVPNHRAYADAWLLKRPQSGSEQIDVKTAPSWRQRPAKHLVGGGVRVGWLMRKALQKTGPTFFGVRGIVIIIQRDPGLRRGMATSTCCTRSCRFQIGKRITARCWSSTRRLVRSTGWATGQTAT